MKCQPQIFTMEYPGKTDSNGKQQNLRIDNMPAHEWFNASFYIFKCTHTSQSSMYFNYHYYKK